MLNNTPKYCHLVRLLAITIFISNGITATDNHNSRVSETTKSVKLNKVKIRTPLSLYKIKNKVSYFLTIAGIENNQKFQDVETLGEAINQVKKYFKHQYNLNVKLVKCHYNSSKGLSLVFKVDREVIVDHWYIDGKPLKLQIFNYPWLAITIIGNKLSNSIVFDINNLSPYLWSQRSYILIKDYLTTNKYFDGTLDIVPINNGHNACLVSLNKPAYKPLIININDITSKLASNKTKISDIFYNKETKSKFTNNLVKKLKKKYRKTNLLARELKLEVLNTADSDSIINLKLVKFDNQAINRINLEQSLKNIIVDILERNNYFNYNLLSNLVLDRDNKTYSIEILIDSGVKSPMIKAVELISEDYLSKSEFANIIDSKLLLNKPLTRDNFPKLTAYQRKDFAIKKSLLKDNKLLFEVSRVIPSDNLFEYEYQGSPESFKMTAKKVSKVINDNTFVGYQLDYKDKFKNFTSTQRLTNLKNNLIDKLRLNTVISNNNINYNTSLSLNIDKKSYLSAKVNWEWLTKGLSLNYQKYLLGNIDIKNKNNNQNLWLVHSSPLINFNYQLTNPYLYDEPSEYDTNTYPKYYFVPNYQPLPPQLLTGILDVKHSVTKDLFDNEVTLTNNLELSKYFYDNDDNKAIITTNNLLFQPLRVTNLLKLKWDNVIGLLTSSCEISVPFNGPDIFKSSYQIKDLLSNKLLTNILSNSSDLRPGIHLDKTLVKHLKAKLGDKNLVKDLNKLGNSEVSEDDDDYYIPNINPNLSLEFKLSHNIIKSLSLNGLVFIQRNFDINKNYQVLPLKSFKLVNQLLSIMLYFNLPINTYVFGIVNFNLGLSWIKNRPNYLGWEYMLQFLPNQ